MEGFNVLYYMDIILVVLVFVKLFFQILLFLFIIYLGSEVFGYIEIFQFSVLLGIDVGLFVMFLEDFFKEIYVNIEVIFKLLSEEYFYIIEFFFIFFDIKLEFLEEDGKFELLEEMEVFFIEFIVVEGIEIF